MYFSVLCICVCNQKKNEMKWYCRVQNIFIRIIIIKVHCWTPLSCAITPGWEASYVCRFVESLLKESPAPAAIRPSIDMFNKINMFSTK